DNQTAVTVKVYQGERKMAAKNRLLGEFNLEGIPSAPRGVPQVEVKFDIDADGILQVTARDLGSDKEATVRIDESAGLSEAEIEGMRADAEDNAEDDKRQFELAEARNQAGKLCHQLEKMIKDNDDNLTDDDKEPLNQALERTRAVAQEDDTQAIRTAFTELEQVLQAFSKTLYENSTAASAERPGLAIISESIVFARVSRKRKWLTRFQRKSMK
ncbi:MAG: Hsp70 family protein, partial [Pirellulaceae bacterium]